MNLNRRLFLLILIAFGLIKGSNSSNSYLTKSPVNCLSSNVRKQMDTIVEKVELEPEKVSNLDVITSKMKSICLNKCKQKAAIVITMLNSVFTVAFDQFNQDFGTGKEIEEIVVKFVPDILPQYKKRNENEKKIGCRCSMTKIKMYGSISSKSILGRIIKEILSEKRKNWDINLFIDEACKIPKIKNCIVDLKLPTMKKTDVGKVRKILKENNNVGKAKQILTKHNVGKAIQISTKKRSTKLNRRANDYAAQSETIRDFLRGIKIFRQILVWALLYLFFVSPDLFRQTLDNALPWFIWHNPTFWAFVLFFTLFGEFL